MMLKNTITALLLLFVAGSLGYLLQGRLYPAEPGEAEVLQTPNQGTVVWYFYSGPPCDTCRKLKSYALESLQEHFKKQLDSGTLQWGTLNMEKPPNEHYASDFGLFTKSIVLIKFKEGKPEKWQNLDRIWDLVDDRAAYSEYIRSQTLTFLGEKSE
jgi:hypothetical protein